MEIFSSEFPGVFRIKPQVFSDSRGYFMESYRKEWCEAAEFRDEFVQENQSFSRKGTIRGLHLQLDPYQQAKLVRVIRGKVLDVILDLRKESPTFGKVGKFILDEDSQESLMIPTGFAHGFAALEDSIFFYKCSNYYDRDSEAGIKFDDPELNIDWEVEHPLISEKDRELPDFATFKKLYLNRV